MTEKELKELEAVELKKEQELFHEDGDDMGVISHLWVFDEVQPGFELPLGQAVYKVRAGHDFEIGRSSAARYQLQFPQNKIVGGNDPEQWPVYAAKQDFFVVNEEKTRRYRDEIIAAKSHLIEVADPDGTVIVYRPAQVGEPGEIIRTINGLIYFADKRDSEWIQKNTYYREKYAGKTFDNDFPKTTPLAHEFYVKAPDEDQLWFVKEEKTEELVNNTVHLLDEAIGNVLRIQDKLIESVDPEEVTE